MMAIRQAGASKRARRRQRNAMKSATFWDTAPERPLLQEDSAPGERVERMLGAGVWGHWVTLDGSVLLLSESW